MRWFKHLTDASDDAFIHSLEARFGLEGYARWWKLCEKIGKFLKPADTSASLALPWSVWESYLKGKRKQLRSFLEAIEKEGRILLEENGDVLRIELPKLLKFRDEYLQRSRQVSGQTPDGTRDKLHSKNIDTEDRVQKKKPTPSELKKKTAAKVEVPEDYTPPAEMVERAKTELRMTEFEIRQRTQRFVLDRRAKGIRYVRVDLAWWNWLTDRFVGGNVSSQHVRPKQESFNPPSEAERLYEGFMKPGAK